MVAPVMRRLAATALSLGWLAACAGGDSVPVDFRIVHAPGDDPYAGGADLVVALESPEGTTVDERAFAIDARSGEAPPVPDGLGWRFRVDVVSDVGVLARGRSFPFDVTNGRAPEVRPDVLLGTLGTFWPALGSAPGETIVAVTPAEGGALLATDGGHLYRYRAHAGASGEASLERVGTAAGRAGAAWAAIDEGLLLAVGGESGGASLHDASGARVGALDSLEPQRHGMTVAAVPGRRAVLVVGGSPAVGALPVADVRRIDVEDAARGARLVVAELPPMAVARRGASAIGVPVHDPDGVCPCARVVVFGGTDGTVPLSSAELLDPDGGDTPTMLAVDSAVRGAAAVVVDVGLVMLAGGRATDNSPVSEVRTLDVRPGALRPVSPPPDPLNAARSDAAAVRFGPGLVLIAGGRGAGEMALSTVELYDFETDRFGDAAATGSLTTAQEAPRAAALADGTVLVTGAAGLAVYQPPRGGGL